MWRVALVLVLISTACGSVHTPAESPPGSNATSTVNPLPGGKGGGGGLGGGGAATGSRTNSGPPAVVSASPLARGSGMMAWDPQLNVLLLFGGQGPDVLSDTWTWTGTAWTGSSAAAIASSARTQPPGPSARRWGTMFYDPISRSVILFGGWSADGDVMLSDTWAWNGSWSQLSPARSPSPRSLAAAAFDPYLDEAILFGGWASGANLLNDTWAWNGSTWSQVQISGSPPASLGSVMGYRQSDHEMQLALFDGGPAWLFDGTGWSAAAGGSLPNCRYGYGAADDGHSAIVIFGGYTCNTYVWDGQSWSSLNGILQPPGRGDEGGSPMMSYVPGVGVIMFGGHVPGVGYAQDFWVWDGSTWSRQQ